MKSHWFSKHLPTIRAGKALHFSTVRTNDGKKKIKNPVTNHRDICYKKEFEAKESKVAAQHFTPPSKRKRTWAQRNTDTTSDWETQPVSKQKRNPGRNIKMLKEAADQWKTVSMLDTDSCSSAPAHKPTHTLQARLWSKSSR